MSKAKRQSDPERNNERVVTQNRRARYQYDVLDTLECGIALLGSEVKSLRNGKVSIEEAFARVKDGEVWLYNCDIPEYPQANRFNHEPKRPRKLLLHRREIQRFASQATQKGLTLIPLKIYFTRGRAKVLLGLCRGRKEHDKREIIKKEESKREIRQMVQRYQNR